MNILGIKELEMDSGVLNLAFLHVGPLIHPPKIISYHFKGILPPGLTPSVR